MTLLLLGAVLLIAAGWDVAQRRIPNPLVLCGLLLGPALAAYEGGSQVLLPCGAGFALATALTFPQWMLKWMGGGDAKLFMVVGATLGPWPFLNAMVWSLAANGVLALVMVLLKKAAPMLGRSIDTRLPMAVAIAAGTGLGVGFPLF